MENIKKVLKRQLTMVLATVLVIAMALGTYAYTKYKQIDDVIFLEHYMDLPIDNQGESYVTLYYITDKTYDEDLYQLDFSYADIQTQVEFQEVDNYRFYSLHKVELKLYLSESDIRRIKDRGSIELSTGMAYMSNSDEFAFDLGHLVISNDTGDMNHLASGGSLGNGRSEFSIDSEDGMTLNSFDFIYPDVIGDYIDFTVKAEGLNQWVYSQDSLKDLPLSTKSETDLIVVTRGALHDGKVLDLKLRLGLTSVDGDQGTMILNIASNEDMDDELINRLVKEAENE